MALTLSSLAADRPIAYSSLTWGQAKVLTFQMGIHTVDGEVVCPIPTGPGVDLPLQIYLV